MTLAIGDTAPDFEADTTQGRIRFHDWIGDSWAVLFSHPKDFTPVCTTELGYMAKIKPEFDRRNVKIIGISVDPIDRHAKWADDIKETQGYAPNYPMIGDPTLAVSKLYGMLPAEAAGTSEGRTPADNQTVRNVFVIGPDKKVKLVLVYPMTTGRNFDEVVRVIDSLQLTADHKVLTRNRGDVPARALTRDDVLLAWDHERRIFCEDHFASLTYAGTETVYDLTEPATHHFIGNGICVHNCSEYMFLDDTACNLSSLNLLRFYDFATHRFDIDQATGSFRRNEVYVDANWGRSVLELSYFSLSQEEAALDIEARKEVNAQATG